MYQNFLSTSLNKTITALKITDIATEHFSYQLGQLHRIVLQNLLQIFKRGFYQHVCNSFGDRNIKYLLILFSTIEIEIKKWRRALSLEPTGGGTNLKLYLRRKKSLWFIVHQHLINISAKPGEKI